MDEIKVGCILGRRFFVSLHGVIEGALSVEYSYEAGLAPPVGIFCRLADISCLLEHVFFNPSEQVAGGHILQVGILDFVSDISLQGLDPGFYLSLLLPDTFNFALVPIKNR